MQDYAARLIQNLYLYYVKDNTSIENPNCTGQNYDLSYFVKYEV